MVSRTRKTVDDRIADAKAKLVALKAKKKEKAQKEREKKKNLMSVALTKDSAGMQELLNQIGVVMTQNKVKAADVIKAASRFKRTGLTFEDRTKKTKETQV